MGSVYPLLLPLLVLGPLTGASVPGAVQDFVNTESSNSHLRVDRLTGDVFVAATNKIYKLNSDLQVIKVRSTGPVQDSPTCLTYYNIEDRGCSDGASGAQGQPMDNWNKALVIDQQNRILIHCGTAYHGVCWTTPIDAFATDSIRGGGMVERPVVGNDKEANVVTMVVQGENWAKVLGVAVTNTGRSAEHSDVVPAISFRQLRSPTIESLLDIVNIGSSSRKGEIRMTSPGADFPVKYIYGFESRNFNYWVAVQPRGSRGSGFETRLIRQCQRDVSYMSYIDIKIGCVGAERSKKFNVATAAVVGKAGLDLGDSFGFQGSQSGSSTSDVLYVAFSAALSNSSWEVEKESAICMFSVEEIRGAFEASWNECFSNRNCKPASYVVGRNGNGGERNKRQVNLADGDCTRASKTPLEGSVTLLQREAVNVHDKITALAVNATGRFTVVFAGTERGAFKKIALEKQDYGYEYETVVVDSQRAVLSDLEFDRTGSHLYVLTKHKVTKFKLHTTCSDKKDCGECFEDGDPFCGWCTSLAKCMDNSQQTQCPRSYNSSSSAATPSWITYKEPDSCPQATPICSELAENCATCTTLSSKYKDCGWCPAKSGCLTKAECPTTGQWVPAGGSCGSAPSITKFEPISGPLEGGTNVSIVVPNLYSHIQSFVPSLHVTVADTPCKVFQSSTFDIATSTSTDDVVTCRITKTPGRPNHNGARSGPVIIQIEATGLRIESRDKFHLVNPLLGGISPKKGALRGGAKLKVSGVHLDAGRVVKVFLGNLACPVLSRSSQEIQCLTPTAAQTGNMALRVEIDGNDRIGPEEFQYVDGPEVLETKPSVIHGTLDGGQHFEVIGTNFQTVQVAQFVVAINDQGYFGECSATSDTIISCTTPAINGTGAEIRSQVIKSRGLGNDTDDDGAEGLGLLVLRYFFRFDGMETHVSGKDPDKHEYYLDLTHHDDAGSGLTLFISISLVLLFIICSATLYIVYRRWGVSRRGPILPKALPSAILTRSEVDDFFKGKPNTNMDKGVLKVESPYVIPYNDKYEISEKRFTIDRNRPLGSGMYGLVLQGKIDGIPTAVKTLKPDAEKMHLTALMSELKILVHLASTKHPHVVNLVGAYTKRIHEGTLYMFVEYCPFGSLDKRLRSSRKLFCNQIQDDVIDLTVSNPQKYEQVDPRDIVCTFDLVNYAHQIAKGMEYLAEKKVIHADMAARNILLVNQTTVKITDFGLARKLYDYTNYVKKQQEPLPWRWMALESLQDLSFSTQSDVWAYGVTLWEMFTLGEMPYPGLSWSVDFPDRLVHGLKNVKPKFATSDIYNTMQECWQLKPEDRPSFTDLRKFFNALLQDLSSQVQESRDEDGYLMPLLQRPNSTNV